MTEDRPYGAAPVAVSHPVIRYVYCLRCGNLMAWSWCEGDTPRVADLNFFFDLMHHGPWWKGHILRLRKEQT